MGGAQGGQYRFDLLRAAVQFLRMRLTLPWGNPFIVLMTSPARILALLWAGPPGKTSFTVTGLVVSDPPINCMPSPVGPLRRSTTFTPTVDLNVLGRVALRLSVPTLVIDCLLQCWEEGREDALLPSFELSPEPLRRCPALSAVAEPISQGHCRM